MTKTLISISIVLCGIIFSCKNETKSSDTPKATFGDTLSLVPEAKSAWIFDSLSIRKKVHINDDPKKMAMNISVFIAFPKSSPTGINLDAVQKTIAELFDSKHRAATIKEAFDNMVKDYTDDAHNYGKEWEDQKVESVNFSNYEQHISASVDYVSPYLITISTAQSSYLGGAHGSYYVKYNNIATQDGKLLAEDVLFKTGYKAKLSKLIQAEVERRNQSPNEDDHILLLVENKEITANNNFYFDKNDIVYVFNQYEIAPYVQGVIEIRIPVKKIALLVNDRFLPILNTIPEKVLY